MYVCRYMGKHTCVCVCLLVSVCVCVCLPACVPVSRRCLGLPHCHHEPLFPLPPASSCPGPDPLQALWVAPRPVSGATVQPGCPLVPSGCELGPQGPMDGSPLGAIGVGGSGVLPEPLAGSPHQATSLVGLSGRGEAVGCSVELSLWGRLRHAGPCVCRGTVAWEG